MTLPGQTPVIAANAVEITLGAWVEDAVDRTTYNFAGIGVPGELNAFCIHGAGGTGRSNVSVSVDGTTIATVLSPTARTEKVVIAYARLPLGGAGNLQVVWSGSFGRCGVQPAVLHNVVTDTPTGGAAQYQASNTAASATANGCLSGGRILAGVTLNNNNRQTFTNVVETYDKGIEGTNAGVAGGDAAVAADGNITVTSTTAVSDSREITVAAWR